MNGRRFGAIQGASPSLDPFTAESPKYVFDTNVGSLNPKLDLDKIEKSGGLLARNGNSRITTAIQLS